ncbi:hypothetical protein [Nocardia wallacei]|nr:hypothetical protein [Nocardia wallacei]
MTETLDRTRPPALLVRTPAELTHLRAADPDAVARGFAARRRRPLVR